MNGFPTGYCCLSGGCSSNSGSSDINRSSSKRYSNQILYYSNCWVTLLEREYHTYEDIYTALHERHVIGALIDTYSAGSSKDMFEQEHLRVNKILDYSATYGVVMGKEARKLRSCFKDYSEHALASKISHHIQQNTEQLKVKNTIILGNVFQKRQRV